MMSYGWEGGCVRVYDMLEYCDLALGDKHRGVQHMCASTRFARILDANTIPGPYAKINELLLSNLMDNSYNMLGAILTRLSGNMEKPG